jgi:hypothetical protein
MSLSSRMFTLFLVSLLSLSAQAQSLKTTAKSKAPKFSASYDSLYYEFYGRHPADGNIYAFDGVSFSAQTLQLNYLYSPTLQFSVVGRQIRNYAETRFLTLPVSKDHAQGMGDTKVKATKTFLYGFDPIIVDLGVSIPTGAIDIKNSLDPSLNFPYNMQLGTGTYDLEPMLMYIRTRGKHQLGMMGMAILRTGRNDLNYRMGNEYISRVWYTLLADSLLMPGVWLNYRHIQGLTGADPTYGRNQFVEFYHAPRHFWDLSLNINSHYQLTQNLKLKAMVGRPMWQESKNIDNIQVYARWFAQLGAEGTF